MTRHKSQGGQAIILVALFLPVLFGVVGLAFDIGFLEMMNRQAQTATDAAAVAGAISLPYSDASAAAKAAALSNGFPNSSVTVNTPPSIGPNAGKSNFVEVIISQAEPTFFLRMIGAGSTTKVAARAVAYNRAGDCIFALSPTAGPSGSIDGSSCPGCTSALFVGGDSLINVSGCSVQVDSTTAGSLWLEWGNLYTNYMGDAAPSYWCGEPGNVPVGNGDPGCYDPEYDNVTMYPQPAKALSDPLAYLSPPTSTSCTSGGIVWIYSSAYSTGGSGSFSNPYTYNITPGSGSIPSCPDIVITQACPAPSAYNCSAAGFTNTTFNPGTYHSITMGYGYCCYEGEYVDPVLPNYPVVNFNPGVYNIMGSVPYYKETTPTSGVYNYFCLSYWWSFDFGADNPCGMALFASNATIQNTGGVTFYLGAAGTNSVPNPTGGGGAAIDGCWGGYFISGFYGCGPNSVNLTATTTGSYAGILFYGDRSNPYTACFGGCSNYPTATPTNQFVMSGAMYFPDAGLYFSGCCQGTGGASASSTYQISVAQTLNFYFDNFYSNYSSLPGGSPIKQTSLVE